MAQAQSAILTIGWVALAAGALLACAPTGGGRRGTGSGDGSTTGPAPDVAITDASPSDATGGPSDGDGPDADPGVPDLPRRSTRAVAAAMADRSASPAS